MEQLALGATKLKVEVLLWKMNGDNCYRCKDSGCNWCQYFIFDKALDQETGEQIRDPAVVQFLKNLIPSVYFSSDNVVQPCHNNGRYKFYVTIEK